ncbi:hypothetical protein [Aquimarina pacifica]|uniref:hypothetical protein n=1 Tax=Aquimarina pacifica TaxID=1296415 RepID=UPI001376BDD0|nr:hypothetical protein [Aquimarina pacifica]
MKNLENFDVQELNIPAQTQIKGGDWFKDLVDGLVDLVLQPIQEGFDQFNSNN